MNPFEEFEKNAAAAGFTTEQIETLKKEALASIDPEQKKKEAEERAFANYMSGFAKAAHEFGVAAGEAEDLFKIAMSVKPEQLPVAVRNHFGRTQEKTAATIEDSSRAAFAVGFVKQAEAIGLPEEATADALEKIGFDLDIKQMIQSEPRLAGALLGGAGGAGVGALAGGEGHRGKGALLGGLAGAGLCAGAGHAYGLGGDIKEGQLERTLRNYKDLMESAAANGQGTDHLPGMLEESVNNINSQGNYRALLNHILGRGIKSGQ